MKISILDDYHDTLRTLDCFKKLSGHEIKIGTITSRISMRWPNDCGIPKTGTDPRADRDPRAAAPSTGQAQAH